MKENAVTRRLVLFAATWAAVVGLVAGSAHAQAPAPPGGGFILSGVVMLEGGKGLAWIQEPSFTNNKVVTVRLGDSVGPYRVTKILTHQVELAGPGGTVSVPLAGVPGAVGVATSAGTSSPETSDADTSSAGTGQTVASTLSPPPALDPKDGSVIPRGDPSRIFPASQLLIGAGATVSVLPERLPVPASVQTPTSTPSRPSARDPEDGSVISRDDPRRKFPTKALLIGG
jgi:hypothetical protein